MKAEDFTLPDQDNRYHTLSDYLGKWVVLYFYPKDDTQGCTKEACSFRDTMQKLSSKNVVVLGVSADSPDSHNKFISKYDLNFNLLSDESKDIIKKYNAWGKKLIYGKEVIGIIRKTYIIDPEGIISKIYEKVSTENNIHTNEILKDLTILQNN